MTGKKSKISSIALAALVGGVLGLLASLAQSAYFAFSWAAMIETKFVPGASPDWYAQWKSQMWEGFKVLLAGGLVENGLAYCLGGAICSALAYLLWTSFSATNHESELAQSRSDSL